MGQYHQVFNLDKKEFLSPHAMDCGAKLMEWGSGGPLTQALAVLLCNSNGRGGGDLNVRNVKYNSKTLKSEPTKKQIEAEKKIKEIAGRWAGDRIVVQGDYAEGSDPAYITAEERDGFNDISSLCIEVLRATGELI